MQPYTFYLGKDFYSNFPAPVKEHHTFYYHIITYISFIEEEDTSYEDEVQKELLKIDIITVMSGMNAKVD